MDFVIAIPSHGRAQSIKKKTLRVLQDAGWPPELTFVFVAPEEIQDYKNLACCLVPSILGLANQRNFIRNYFPPGQKIVYMDDDISDFVSVCYQETHSECHRIPKHIPIMDVLSAFESVFAEMEKVGASLGGIYPAANGFFMTHDKYTTDLRYIVGACYMEINSHCLDLYLEPGTDEGEDYIRSIKHFIHSGQVVRACWFAPLTSYFKGKGGLNSTRTPESFKKALESIHASYPNHCRIIEGKQFSKLMLHYRP